MSNKEEKHLEAVAMSERSAQHQKNKTPINKWKVAFLSLVAILVTGIVVLFAAITAATPNAIENTAATQNVAGAKLVSLTSTKKELTTVIDQYLTKDKTGSAVDYQFSLEKQAVLTGKVKVFGVGINYNLYFDPYVMDNGNIQLKAKSMSLGSLGLPIKEVLKIVKATYKLPAFVEVQPSDEMIIVRLDKLKLTSGLRVKADKIDLVDDKIEASLYLPKNK